MTALESALLEVASLLDELAIPYMLIGGLAVAEWEVPRATLDIDVTVWVEPAELATAVSNLCLRLVPKPQDPLAFVRATRVLPAMSSQGVPVDLIFAVWPAEQEAIRNAVHRQVAGRLVRVAALEYLLLLKLTSDRDKDYADAARLVQRHRGRFDAVWLEERLTEISEALSQPSILERYRRALGLS